MAPPPADKTMDSDASAASEGTSSAGDQQSPSQPQPQSEDHQQQKQEPRMQTASTDGPALVQDSKQWTIPTANFKPSPRPAPQPESSSRSGSHVNIPKIGPNGEGRPAKNHIEIPKITPMSSSSEPSKLAVGLDGKYVDEFGNILDWDGTVLGRVEGDLPSMIGRPVSRSGEILDEDGEVVGYVCENYIKPTLKALGGGLQVDSTGKIYDGEGNVIGNLNNTPNAEKLLPGNGGNNDSGDLANKPNAAPKPSEIYLDVKSTHDGIQLIIKIPTVFKQEESSTSKE